MANSAEMHLWRARAKRLLGLRTSPVASGQERAFYSSWPERTPWPLAHPHENGTQPNVGIVVVNFNTVVLITHLIFSLYRILSTPFTELVVVDNGSTDGSSELLGALDEDGLLRVIQNQEQRYHGPGLTQGVSWLAERQSVVSANEQLDYVWIIDSDVVIVRPDTLKNAIQALERSDVVAVGQWDFGVEAPRDLLVKSPLLHPCCLLFDPAVLWQPYLPPFLESGLPSRDLQAAAESFGLRTAPFPFVEREYIIHLGCSTLRAVAELGNSDNRYYSWALTNNQPHFASNTRAPTYYARFCELFDEHVPYLTPENLISACRRSKKLSLSSA